MTIINTTIKEYAEKLTAIDAQRESLIKDASTNGFTEKDIKKAIRLLSHLNEIGQK